MFLIFMDAGSVLIPGWDIICPPHVIHVSGEQQLCRDLGSMVTKSLNVQPLGAEAVGTIGKKALGKSLVWLNRALNPPDLWHSALAGLGRSRMQSDWDEDQHL